MVLYHYTRVDDEGHVIPMKEVPYQDGTVWEGEAKKELYRAFMQDRLFVELWKKAIRRACVDIDGDYSIYNVSKSENDIQNFPLFDRSGRICYIDRKLYYYRKNPDSITRNPGYGKIWACFWEYRVGKDYIRKWNLSPDVLSKRCSFLFCRSYHLLAEYFGSAHTAGERAEWEGKLNELLAEPEFMTLCRDFESLCRPKTRKLSIRLFCRACQKKQKTWIIMAIRIACLKKQIKQIIGRGNRTASMTLFPAKP